MTFNSPELDLYMVLGVERHATHDEIREAYELAKIRGEVDLGDSGHGPARSHDIESAYAVLKDPSKRADYDKSLD